MCKIYDTTENILCFFAYILHQMSEIWESYSHFIMGIPVPPIHLPLSTL